MKVAYQNVKENWAMIKHPLGCRQNQVVTLDANETKFDFLDLSLGRLNVSSCNSFVSRI